MKRTFYTSIIFLVCIAFFLSAIKLDPETIEVIGGNRILENIATIYTAKIPLDNLQQSGSMMINPVLNPASLKISSESKDKIIVSYVIIPRFQ